jgi:ribonuclease VapC
MVIDTSALIAVMTSETDAGQYESAIKRYAKRLMSVATILEAAIILEKRFGEEGPQGLEDLLRRLPIEAVPFDGDQLEWARYAHRT